MPPPTRFGELLGRYLDRGESFMLVMVIAGVLCHFLGMAFANQVMVLAFSGLAIVFFLNAFRPPRVPLDEPVTRKDFPKRWTHTILPKLLWISSAVGASALAMVHQQAVEAAYQQLFLIQGVVAVGSLLAIGLAVATGNEIQHLIPILYRAIPLTLAGAHFLGYY